MITGKAAFVRAGASEEKEKKGKKKSREKKALPPFQMKIRPASSKEGTEGVVKQEEVKSFIL